MTRLTGDAHERCRVGVLGHRANGGADPGVVDEQVKPDEHQERRDNHQDRLPRHYEIGRQRHGAVEKFQARIVEIKGVAPQAFE